MLLRILSFLLNRTFCLQAKASSGLWRKSLESSTIFCAIRAKIVSTKSQKWISLVYKQGRAYYPTAMPNKSFERTARQRASHPRWVVSFKLSLAGGQPLNSGVRLLCDLDDYRLFTFTKVECRLCQTSFQAFNSAGRSISKRLSWFLMRASLICNLAPL